MLSFAWGFILPGLSLLAIMAGLDHGAEDSLTSWKVRLQHAEFSQKM